MATVLISPLKLVLRLHSDFEVRRSFSRIKWPHHLTEIHLGNGIVVFLTVPSASDVPSDLLDVLVTLDGRQFSFTKRAASQPLFGQRAIQLNSGLDPNVEHTVSVAQRGTGVPLRLDSMEILVPTNGQAGPAGQPFT